MLGGLKLQVEKVVGMGGSGTVYKVFKETKESHPTLAVLKLSWVSTGPVITDPFFLPIHLCMSMHIYIHYMFIFFSYYIAISVYIFMFMLIIYLSIFKFL